ncbi:hypothetical protein BD311DRAFT_448439 [Dichomitus squalens]|uniref:Secreted protein n=1 Tax=Dichomitus squalens TaxID=114155 RepID=A0A4Q9MG80_9APHY|nr:hypothetical protein BD311DRAFT_448439 [Dichomitus squalens]
MTVSVLIIVLLLSSHLSQWHTGTLLDVREHDVRVIVRVARRRIALNILAHLCLIWKPRRTSNRLPRSCLDVAHLPGSALGS